MSSDLLDLHGLIWGFPLDTMGAIQISSNESCSELKSMISKELSLLFNTFTLHKMCLDNLPEETVYPDEVIDINTLPTLDPNDKVSDVFHDALSPNNAPHFVVFTLDSKWMAAHFSDEIELSCLISGGTSKSDFKITISKKLKIVDLKARIKEAQSFPETVGLTHIELYDVCISAYDKAKREEALHRFVPSKAQLADSLSLYRIFNFPRPSHIHVIIKVSGQHLRPQHPASTRNLADHRKEYYNSVHQYSARAIPSYTAQPKPFRDFQRAFGQALHCNRGSVDNATPPLPLTLLHPAFGTFMEECRTLVPNAEHNRFAAKFIGEMRLLYAPEYANDMGRAQAVREHFSEWGLTFRESSVKMMKHLLDGELSDPASGCCYGILEVDDEIGSMSAEPYARACFCYEQAFKEKFCETPSVFPCLLILVFGPYLGFAGAAWNVRPTVEILSVVPLFHDPYYPSNVNIQTIVARHLLAMKNALGVLSDHYKISYPVHDPFPTQLFPYATSYPQSGHSQKFEYLKQIQANLIFRGRLLDTQQDIWIKFVRSCSPEAHQFCQEKGHAPNLLGFRKLDGDWVMVVTEDLGPSYLTLNETRGPLPVSLMNGIRQVIGELHEAGFVHGDIRDCNIMVHQQDKTKFMIVDWDWSGVNNVVRYPPNVNQEVKRPAGATDGELILPVHDLEMLDYIENTHWGGFGTVRKRALTSAGEELQCKVPRTGPVQ